MKDPQPSLTPTKIYTLIIRAIQENNLKKLRTILETANSYGQFLKIINYHEEGSLAPIQYAIEHDKIEAAKIILEEAGPENFFILINYRINDQSTAIESTIKDNKPEILRIILEAANVYKVFPETVNYLEEGYLTPLESAIKIDKNEAVTTILEEAGPENFFTLINQEYQGSTLIKSTIFDSKIKILKSILKAAHNYRKLAEVISPSNDGTLGLIELAIRNN